MPGVAKRHRLPALLILVITACVFAERLERDVYFSGISVPDLAFLGSSFLLCAYILANLSELAGPSAAARRLTCPEMLATCVVALLLFLSLVAVVTLPASDADAVQTFKTALHLVALFVAAIALGVTLPGAFFYRVYLLYFVIGSITALLALVQAVDMNLLNGHLIDFLGLYSRAYDLDGRLFYAPTGPFSEPAKLGYFSASAALVGALAIYPRRPVLGIVGVASCTAALLLSSSIGSVAAAASAALYLAMRSNRRRVGFRTIALCIAVCVPIIAVLSLSPAGDVVVHRATGIAKGSDASAEYRLELNRASTEIWRIAPVTGVGLGNTRLHLPDLVQVSYRANVRPTFQDSSVYFGMLGESGPIGVLAIIVLLGALVLRGRFYASVMEDVAKAQILLLATKFAFTGGFLGPPLWYWIGVQFALERSRSRDNREGVRGSLRANETPRRT